MKYFKCLEIVWFGVLRYDAFETLLGLYVLAQMQVHLPKEELCAVVCCMLLCCLVIVLVR